MKSVQIKSFFWSVFSCIRNEYRRIRTRRHSIFRHFSRSDNIEINNASNLLRDFFSDFFQLLAAYLWFAATLTKTNNKYFPLLRKCFNWKFCDIFCTKLLLSEIWIVSRNSVTSQVSRSRDYIQLINQFVLYDFRGDRCFDMRSGNVYNRLGLKCLSHKQLVHVLTHVVVTIRGIYYKYVKSPAFGAWHLHFCTFTRIQNFHPLSHAFYINHPQSPAFWLMETKLSRKIFLREQKRNIGHRSIRVSSN